MALQAKAEMRWLIPIGATGVVGFYLRFLWAMKKELQQRREDRPIGRTRQQGPRHNLIRVDPADFWAEKSARDSSRIKDSF